MKLFPYQSKTVKDIVQGLEDGVNQVLAFYTGSGKTEMFLEVIQRLQKKHPRAKIGVACHFFTEIKEQTSQRANFEHITLGGKERKIGSGNIYVFNPQFFRFNELKYKFDYLIVDEFHFGMSRKGNTYQNIFDRACKGNCRYLFVSATPWSAMTHELFKDAKIHVRGLDKGFLHDKRVNDFEVFCEKYNMRPEYNSNQEITTAFLKANMDDYIAMCLVKLHKTIKEFPSKIGSKVLVCCPPGENRAIAKAVAAFLGEDAVLHIGKGEGQEIEFKRSKKRFLVTVNKCQAGYDFPEMDTIIDLTMTRNIPVLVQRLGRLARYAKKRTKRYHYVYDERLRPEQVEWIFSITIDYANGLITDPPTNTRMFEIETRISGRDLKDEFTFKLSDKLALYEESCVAAYKVLKFSELFKPAREWTRSLAKETASKYTSRTELSSKDRGCYNFLLKTHPEDLDELFPRRKKADRYTLAQIKSLALQCQSRKEFKSRFGGACKALYEKGIYHEKLDEWLPLKLNSWTYEKCVKHAKKCRNFRDFKVSFSGGYSFLYKNGLQSALCKEMGWRYNRRRQV